MNSLTIIGAGKVGNSLVNALTGHLLQPSTFLSSLSLTTKNPGLRIGPDPGSPQISCRTFSYLDLKEQLTAPDNIILLATKDRQIKEVYTRLLATLQAGLADVAGKRIHVGHLSGPQTSRLLPMHPLISSTFSLHPLQSFSHSNTPFHNVPFVFEAHPESPIEEQARIRLFCERLTSSLGAHFYLMGGSGPDSIDTNKARYHLAAVMASNLFVSLEQMACRSIDDLPLMIPQGVQCTPRPRTDNIFLPILETTLQNIGRFGPEHALTGPIVRGDIQAVQTHIALLEKDASMDSDAVVCKLAYLVLSLNALELAKPKLDPQTVHDLRTLLVTEIRQSADHLK